MVVIEGYVGQNVWIWVNGDYEKEEPGQFASVNSLRWIDGDSLEKAAVPRA